MVTRFLLNRTTVLMHICDYKRSICLKARLAHGVLGFPNTSDFTGSIHIKLQMLYKGMLFYKSLFPLRGYIHYYKFFSMHGTWVQCYFYFSISDFRVSKLEIKHSECADLSKVGNFPKYWLTPKTNPLINWTTFSESACHRIWLVLNSRVILSKRIADRGGRLQTMTDERFEALREIWAVFLPYRLSNLNITAS